MNRKAAQVVTLFVVLMTCSAFLLSQVQSGLRLSPPGVKVGNVPLYGEKGNVIARTSVILPQSVPGFVVDNPPITQGEISVLPTDTTFGRRRYRTEDGFNAQINTILMGTDRTSIHTPDFCIRGQGWQINGTEKITIPMSKPVPYDLRVLKVSTSFFTRAEGKPVQLSGIFIYWFVADGHVTCSREERMWLSARELFTKARLQRWAYISYFSICLPGQENVCAERLTAFIQQTVPEFQVPVEKPPGNGSQSAQSILADLNS